jgi:hypothetical protein
MLAESVRSWHNQDDNDWAGVVVGNQYPVIDLGERIEFVRVDFDPPAMVAGPRTGLAAVLRDKGTKLAVGLLRARQLGASHVMFVDADDFVSRQIAGFVTHHPHVLGWVITDGWRYNAERAVVRRHRGDFHLQCGSSHIVRTDVFRPFTASTTASQARLYAGFGAQLERWMGSHMHIHDDLPLQPLPFPGALYRVGTAESHSGNSLAGWSRPVSVSMAKEFAIAPSSSNAAVKALSLLPSRQALLNRLRRFIASSRR